MAAAASASALAASRQPPTAWPARLAPSPMLHAAVAFSLGLLFSRYAAGTTQEFLFAATAFLLAAALFFRRQNFGVARGLALLAIAASAALNLQLAEASAPAPPAAMAELTDGRASLITAHVTREGITAGGFLPHESADVETEEISRGGKMFPLHAGVRISIYSPAAKWGESADESAARPQLPRLHYGERIQFLAKLRAPRNFMDAGAFDYRGFLAQQGITALGSTRTDRVQLLAGFSGSRLAWWRSRIRASVEKKIRELWPGKQGALMSAMLLGDRTGVDRATTLDYQRTGAYHILVVAGLKVGILAAALLWLFGRLRAPQSISLSLTIAGCA